MRMTTRGGGSKRRLVTRGRPKDLSGSPRTRKLVSKGAKTRRLADPKSIDSKPKDRLMSMPHIAKSKASKGSKSAVPCLQQTPTSSASRVSEEGFSALSSFRFKSRKGRTGSLSGAVGTDDKGTPTASGSLLLRQVSHGGTAKHVDHFTLGIRVGSGLGDCYLGLQKLENSLSKHCSVADDIRGFLLDLTATGGAALSPMSEAAFGSAKKRQSDEELTSASPRGGGGLSPETLEECGYLLVQFDKTTREVKQRMKGLNGFVSNLHHVLEQMDEAHARALEQGCCVPKSVGGGIGVGGGKGSSLEDLQRIQELEAAFVKAQAERDAAKEMCEDKMKACQQTEKELLERENELDKEVIAIEKHSAVVREQSERLKQDREHFKKEKERWEEIVQEQQRRWHALEQSICSEGDEAKKLAALQRSVIDERKKLHKEKKAMAKERKKLKKTLERGGLASAGSEAGAATTAQPSTTQIGMYRQPVTGSLASGIQMGGYGAVGSGGYVRGGGGYGGMGTMGMGMGSTTPGLMGTGMGVGIGVGVGAPMMSFDEGAEYSYAGSEYAETVVSDGMTDLQSLDSFGSGES